MSPCRRASWSHPARRCAERAPGARPGGFTLLEVLVALAVLSVTLLALYHAFASTVAVNTTAEGLWRAMLYANNELAGVERRPAPPVSVQQGEFGDDHPLAGYRWQREVSDEEPLPGVTVRKVAYTLTWQEGGREQSYTAEVYVPPPQ